MRPLSAARAAAAAGLLLSLADPARAQVSPRQVNDCTFLKNPTDLRECIERAEAGRLYRGAVRPDDDSRIVLPDTMIDAAGAIPGRKPAQARPAPPAPPSGSVWVDQVRPGATARPKSKPPATRRRPAPP